MKSNGEVLKAGDRIDKGSVIDLVIGDGYARSNFSAPSLVGNDIENARFIILGSNLEIGLITLEADTVGKKSIVTKQSPAAGRQVRIGDPIDIWIAPEGFGGNEEDN